MKEIINRIEFDEVMKRGDKFVVIFTQPSCGFCKALLKTLKDYDTKNFYFMDVHSSLGDYVYYRKVAKLKQFYPYTRVYKHGEILKEFNGLLYDSQIKKLFKEL